MAVYGGWDERFEFGRGPDEGDDGVVVGEEGGDEAETEVAGGADEEYFHGWWVVGLVVIGDADVPRRLMGWLID